MSNLVEHAKRELELIGEEPETVAAYIRMIEDFAQMGHSGGSASVFIDVLHKLLQFQNVTPLTDNPQEWMLISNYLWQSRRNPEAFSIDGGKTHYLLSNKTTTIESVPHPSVTQETKKMSLSEKIYDTILNTDCFCQTGDPTCQDWNTPEERARRIHENVMRDIAYYDKDVIPIPDPLDEAEWAVPIDFEVQKNTSRNATIDLIAGRDAPIVINENGAGQSYIPTRFDLVDGKAMFEMAKVLHEGAEKYGANNWRGIPIDDHLNHLIMHAYAYLAGDRSDEHLSHIMCRAMFAQAVEIEEREKSE